MRSAWTPRPRRFSSIFFGKDSGMVFFLAFLVVATILLPTVSLPRWGRFALAFIFALTIVSGAAATIQQRILRSLSMALTALTLAVNVIGELNPARSSPTLDNALKLICLTILLLMTLRRTLRPGPVTRYRVVGGIAGYLLLGYSWAFAYALVVQQHPSAIHFMDAQEVSPREFNGLIYFSFSTLTTVGYGDAIPVHPYARSLAVAEALAGQLYVTILIASLAGMVVQARSAKDSPGPGEADTYAT